MTNLILARLAARDREFAVRSALGSGRARLARLALTESLLLAVAGGGLGLLFAAVLLRVFVQLAPSTIPEIDRASLDLRVFAVAAVLALAAGAVVGIWPALSVLRSRALQYGPRATAAVRPRMRFTLVTAQIALTVAMLAGSALLLQTLWNLASVPLGYETEQVVTMHVVLNPALYPEGSRGPFFERLLQRIREIGVRIALGAAPADISRQVVGEAGRWIAAGAVLGCALAWAATRAIEAQLYGVGSRDPLSWIAALGVLFVALLLAVLRPAARAARVDPMEALRAD